ncbi:MAG: hypothetical protein WAK93_05955 [Solirubrobacteraceae bacterium]
MDQPTLNALRGLVGDENGVPESLRDRIAGDKLGELQADAAKLIKDLGLTPPRPRDQRGRFSFSDEIRRKAGRAPAPSPDVELPVGDAGIGRGGTARPPSPRPLSMSALIRAHRTVKRQMVRGEAQFLDDVTREAGG